MAATHATGTYGNAVGTVTPLDFKMANLSRWIKTAANTIRPGVLWDGNATIVSGAANMSYNVRAFAVVLTRGATAGAVELTNDSVYNVVTTAAPGSNSRYDVVYLWQREYSIDGTDSNPVIGVVQGSSAASPTVPSLAAFPGAIALAQILVPAGVTATNSGTTITQTAPFTTVADGVVTARTATERDAYVPAAAAVLAKCWVIADGITYKWNGSAWKPWDSPVINVASGVPVSPASGSFTTITSSLRYNYTGGLIFFQYTLTITAVGTASGVPTVTLPFTNGPADAPIWGYESLVTASALVGAIGAGGTTFAIYNNAAGSPWASGRKLNVRGWVEPA